MSRSSGLRIAAAPGELHCKTDGITLMHCALARFMVCSWRVLASAFSISMGESRSALEILGICKPMAVRDTGDIRRSSAKRAYLYCAAIGQSPREQYHTTYKGKPEVQASEQYRTGRSGTLPVPVSGRRLVPQNCDRRLHGQWQQKIKLKVFTAARLGAEIKFKL